MRLPFSPRPKPLAASPRPAGRALYTQILAEIKNCCAQPWPKWIGAPTRARYAAPMALIPKILAPALAIGLSGMAAPALAQSANSYGLRDMKPYDATLAPAPPANGLAQVVRSEKAANSKGKPIGQPSFTIHAFGEVMVDSTWRH